MDDQTGKRQPDTVDDRLAAIDRLDVFTESLAGRVTKYYTDLVDRGLPPDFAQQLARDWHEMQLSALHGIYQKFAG